MRKWNKVVWLGAAALVAVAVTSVSVTADFPLPTAPNGACIFKDGSCDVIPQNICKLAKGRWQGPDTTCP